MYFFSLPRYLVPLKPEHPPKSPVFELHPSLFLPHCGILSFTTGKVLYTLIFIFLIENWISEDSAPKVDVVRRYVINRKFASQKEENKEGLQSQRPGSRLLC